MAGWLAGWLSRWHVSIQGLTGMYVFSSGMGRSKPCSSLRHLARAVVVVGLMLDIQALCTYIQPAAEKNTRRIDRRVCRPSLTHRTQQILGPIDPSVLLCSRSITDDLVVRRWQDHTQLGLTVWKEKGRRDDGVQREKDRRLSSRQDAAIAARVKRPVFWRRCASRNLKRR